ncbi:MAG TPA: sigma-70 family RNA polymerase sigma factor [Phycisphaerae bacterium]|nr:sigma-70 family RNA polymerase sigma factor [Phycisphaerae bacterium]
MEQKQDEQFAQYEGLAIKAATRIWSGGWGKSLRERGVSLEDAVQEARLHLLEILPNLADPKYVREQRVAYVSKTLKGQLLNWAKAQTRNGDNRDLPDPPPGPNRDELLDLGVSLAKLGEDDRSMVLAHYGGEGFKAIGEKYGLSTGQTARRVEKVLAKLKKLMDA